MLSSYIFYLSGQDSDYYDDYAYEGDEYEYEYIDDCEDPDDDGYCETNEEDYEYLEPAFGEDDKTVVSADMGNTARISCTVHDLGE